MTRREEIEKAANEFYKGDEVSTFVVAAQWADKTMIEKACEWAKKRFDLDYCSNVKELLDYVKILVEE
jgi:hypothetical protein